MILSKAAPVFSVLVASTFIFPRRIPRGSRGLPSIYYKQVQKTSHYDILFRIIFHLKLECLKVQVKKTHGISSGK